MHEDTVVVALIVAIVVRNGNMAVTPTGVGEELSFISSNFFFTNSET